MEVLLGQVTKQAMNYAIRTGITITSTYAIRQCGRLLKTVDGQEKQELAALQLRLEGKIRIISPAIDMIELIAARGNTSLESAVALTKSLRWEIQSLGSRLEKAVGGGRAARKSNSKSSRAENEMEVKLIIADIKTLLERIEDAVPLINLAITTSGVNLSTTLPATVSPSRLLQASTFLTAGDMQYCSSLSRAQQIGPVFTLTMYMLFSGHAYRPHDEEGIRETTWKEVMHKARVKLIRVPLDNVYDYPTPFGGDSRQAEEAQHEHIRSESKLHEFAYQILVVEDLDDDRVHTFEDDEPHPTAYEGVGLAGIRELIPIHEISKIFYADTGKILNIGTEGETNNPILLLKRDVNAVPPRRMMERSTVETEYESDGSPAGSPTAGASDEDDEQSALDEQLRRESTAHLPEEPPPEEHPHTHRWCLPPNLDLEWMAFEVYTEAHSSDSEAEEESEMDVPSSASTPQPSGSLSPSLTAGLSNLHLRASTPESTHKELIPSPSKPGPLRTTPSPPHAPTTLPQIRTSLSLLEMLIRLTALQQFQQSSHLAIPDELLTFFLSESSTVGAGGDAELRKRVRREARMRVGFDPYDESPIKRRGEEWLEHEFHEGQGEEGYTGGAGGGPDASSPGAGARDASSRRYDYDTFPHGKTPSPSPSRACRSGSSTPLRSSYSASSSSYYPPSSPLAGVAGRSRSTADIALPSREGVVARPALPHVSSSTSASPLLRRATAQPQGQGRGPSG